MGNPGLRLQVCQTHGPPKVDHYRVNTTVHIFGHRIVVGKNMDSLIRPNFSIARFYGGWCMVGDLGELFADTLDRQAATTYTRARESTTGT